MTIGEAHQRITRHERAPRSVSHKCRLYLITPPVSDPAAFSGALAAALEAGDVAAVQYRPKGIDNAAILDAIRILRPIVQAAGAAFILNDWPELAAESGCDGVHIGQEDMPYRAARRQLGPDGIVGVTCHDSRHLAIEAAEQGADYVAFGAFYPTETKPAKARAKPEILRWWADLTEIPSVAIGGIAPENCATLVQAGADFLAVAGAVWHHPDGPGAAVRALLAAMALANPAERVGTLR